MIDANTYLRNRLKEMKADVTEENFDKAWKLICDDSACNVFTLVEPLFRAFLKPRYNWFLDVAHFKAAIEAVLQILNAGNDDEVALLYMAKTGEHADTQSVSKAWMEINQRLEADIRRLEAELATHSAAAEEPS